MKLFLGVERWRGDQSLGGRVAVGTGGRKKEGREVCFCLLFFFFGFVLFCFLLFKFFLGFTGFAFDLPPVEKEEVGFFFSSF